MRIALITCFNAEWHHGRVPAPYIPLNLLGLAAQLRSDGHQPMIVDQTLALVRGQVTDGAGFHREMAERILGLGVDAVGMTTMCNSYPQTLTLARMCRELDPAVKIILGGPQATVVDVDTINRFPWIDAIIRNEADHSLGAALGRWGEGRDLVGVPGATWRGHDGAVVRNANAPLLADLDALPYPAYDLYPIGEVDTTMAPVEAGRGCPYGCTFCSTNVYFNRRYRIKSPGRLAAEMCHLQREHGFTDFDLVHDMLTVDRRWMREFARVLIDGGHTLRWGCSARVDRVDDELLAEMSAAGCVGVFFGVETGSQRMQSVVLKRLKVDRVLPVMRSCVDHELAPTGSFITGFPEETLDDALASFTMALDIVRLSPRTRVQMHVLAPLVGSPMYEQHRDDLRFDGHSSDMSLFLLGAEELATVRENPTVFPNFYYVHTPGLDRSVAKAISAATYTCPTLFIALREAGADLREVLTGWPVWQRRNVSGEGAQDYYLYRFGVDVCSYVESEVLPTLRAPYLDDLTAYLKLRMALRHGLIADVTVFRQFEHDVQALAASLRGPAGSPAAAATSGFDLLFLNLAGVCSRGAAHLEIHVPRTTIPLVRPGDDLEVREPLSQIRERPDLIIRNNSQRRAFAAKHHLTERHMAALGLLRTPALAGGAST
jgi:radical SAM superfamily enzyme YgiQ (UPF0313 family)